MTQLDSGLLAVDDAFFAALLSADIDSLGSLLADDFILVGVFDGGIVTKSALLEVLGSGILTFVSVEPAEREVRRYGDAAIIVGRTSMKCRFSGSEIGVESRYTHVFAEVEGIWRLVSAQGTPISG